MSRLLEKWLTMIGVALIAAAVYYPLVWWIYG